MRKEDLIYKTQKSWAKIFSFLLSNLLSALFFAAQNALLSLRVEFRGEIYRQKTTSTSDMKNFGKELGHFLIIKIFAELIFLCRSRSRRVDWLVCGTLSDLNWIEISRMFQMLDFLFDFFLIPTDHHMVRTNCSRGHIRQGLCCKMNKEFDFFLSTSKK